MNGIFLLLKKLCQPVIRLNDLEQHCHILEQTGGFAYLGVMCWINRLVNFISFCWITNTGKGQLEWKWSEGMSDSWADYKINNRLYIVSDLTSKKVIRISSHSTTTLVIFEQVVHCHWDALSKYDMQFRSKWKLWISACLSCPKSSGSCPVHHVLNPSTHL